MYAQNRITLVEAKRENEMLGDSMPEATSQAIALSGATGCVLFQLSVTFIFHTDNCVHRSKTIRYCLSDGHQWMFALYTRNAQGYHISYEGIVLTIMEPRPAIQDEFKKDVRRLVEVLYHWVCLRLLAKPWNRF